MINQDFVKELGEKYGFEINSINALYKDDDGTVIECKNLYKKKDNRDLEAFNAGKRYVAKRLLKENIDPRFVSKVTDFPLDYLKKLKNKIN